VSGEARRNARYRTRGTATRLAEGVNPASPPVGREIINKFLCKVLRGRPVAAKIHPSQGRTGRRERIRQRPAEGSAPHQADGSAPPSFDPLARVPRQAPKDGGAIAVRPDGFGHRRATCGDRHRRLESPGPADDVVRGAFSLIWPACSRCTCPRRSSARGDARDQPMARRPGRRTGAGRDRGCRALTLTGVSARFPGASSARCLPRRSREFAGRPTPGGDGR
jgi:hypothetical protein